MSKLPDGWEHYDINGSKLGRPVECGDCGWRGYEEEVDETIWLIAGLLERVSPGEILPVGTCPEIHLDSQDGESICHALVHYSDVEVAWREAPTVLDQIVEATE